MQNYAQLCINYTPSCMIQTNIAYLDGFHYSMGSSRILKQYIKDFLRKGKKKVQKSHKLCLIMLIYAQLCMLEINIA